MEWTRVCLFHRLPYPQIARLLTEPPLQKVEPSSHAGSKFLLSPSPHVAPLEQHVCLCVEGDLLGCFNGKPKEETTIWAGPLFRYPHPITHGLSSSILSHFRRRKVRTLLVLSACNAAVSFKGIPKSGSFHPHRRARQSRASGRGFPDPPRGLLGACGHHRRRQDHRH